MKICVINAAYHLGGASVHAFDVCKGLSRRGHEVLSLCVGSKNREFHQNGYRLKILKQKYRNPIYHYLNPNLIRKLSIILKQYQPDVIHFHNINLQTFSLGALFFSKTYPLVWTLHDVWPLCMTGWPKPPDCNGFLRFCSSCPSWPQLAVRVNREIKEIIYKINKFWITCPTQWMAEMLQSSELAQKPVQVIPLSIDPEIFSDDWDRLELPKNIPQSQKRIILFCGGKALAGELPAWRKGWNFLCEALFLIGRQKENVHLLYVGDPLNLPEEFPVTVTFAQDVTREQMPAYYSAADMFVLPTLGDNSPLTIIEAMSSKTPIVATEVGGIPELIVAGETGILCDPQNAKALADSIAFYLKHPKKATLMAEKGYQRLLDRFTFGSMIERYERVYRNAIVNFG